VPATVPATVPAPGGALRLISGHPVAALLIWFFTVGQAIAFVPVLAARHGVRLPEQAFTTASTWVGLLLPALLIARLVHGPGAGRALLRQTIRVRARLRWYVLCLVVVPLVSVAIASLTIGSPTEWSPRSLAGAYVTGFATHAVLHLLANNLWEELAWTGFVTTQLQARHSPMIAALLTAPLFALQHSPLVFDSGPGGAVVMAALVLLAVPFRMVMSWTYNRTGSLFLVGLAHACGNAVVTGTVLGDALVPTLYGRNAGPLHLFAFAVIGLGVALATRGRLGVEHTVGTAPRVTRSARSRHAA
jgi:membrane protease YdiL (CAAX protease family)